MFALYFNPETLVAMLIVPKEQPVNEAVQLGDVPQSPCPCRQHFIGITEAVPLDVDDCVDKLIYGNEELHHLSPDTLPLFVKNPNTAMNIEVASLIQSV